MQNKGLKQISSGQIDKQGGPESTAMSANFTGRKDEPEYTKLCQGVLLDVQFHFHFPENDHSFDSSRILCCSGGSSSNDPFCGRQRANYGYYILKYIIQECMESSNTPCNLS